MKPKLNVLRATQRSGMSTDVVALTKFIHIDKGDYRGRRRATSGRRVPSELLQQALKSCG